MQSQYLTNLKVEKRYMIRAFTLCVAILIWCHSLNGKELTVKFTTTSKIVGLFSVAFNCCRLGSHNIIPNASKA